MSGYIYIFYFLEREAIPRSSCAGFVYASREESVIELNNKDEWEVCLAEMLDF